MVSVSSSSNNNRSKSYGIHQNRRHLTVGRVLLLRILPGFLFIIFVFIIWQILFFVDINVNNDNINNNNKRLLPRLRPAMTSAIFDESELNDKRINTGIASHHDPFPSNSCGYNTGTGGLDRLTSEELHPVAGKRHMVTPPEDGPVSLVCCETTKGPLSILVHHNWAPLGADHFMNLVESKYFDTGVPMMRCVKNFLCQFGLNSDPSQTKKNNGNLKDDPNWLPEGPSHRENSDGVKRFAVGYLAYAGAGKNSRGNQFIVALKDNGPLAGGSPWEVPWGELVGTESFETLSKIYTGYGEKGPSQGKLHRHGMNEEMKEQFPKLDYINKCVLIEERKL